MTKYALALIGILAISGCHRSSSSRPLVADAPPRLIAPGVQFRQITITKFSEHPRLWVYVPQDGLKTHPCIFIGGAGSAMTTGMSLSEGDQAEHLPYAKAGFVVVAYDISGDGPQIPPAMAAFAKRHLGIDNGKAAIDEALAKLPVDPLRLYAVGHSSAATLALQLAAADRRIRGCVAYAPVTDEVKRVGPVNMQIASASGVAGLIQTLSPLANIEALKCPVMLFSAEDDDNVPTATVSAFADALKALKRDVTFTTTSRGGHHDSMIREGIPAGLKWLARDR